MATATRIPNDTHTDREDYGIPASFPAGPARDWVRARLSLGKVATIYGDPNHLMINLGFTQDMPVAVLDGLFTTPDVARVLDVLAFLWDHQPSFRVVVWHHMRNENDWPQGIGEHLEDARLQVPGWGYIVYDTRSRGVHIVQADTGLASDALSWTFARAGVELFMVQVNPSLVSIADDRFNQADEDEEDEDDEGEPGDFTRDDERDEEDEEDDDDYEGRVITASELRDRDAELRDYEMLVDEQAHAIERLQDGRSRDRSLIRALVMCVFVLGIAFAETQAFGSPVYSLAFLRLPPATILPWSLAHWGTALFTIALIVAAGAVFGALFAYPVATVQRMLKRRQAIRLP